MSFLSHCLNKSKRIKIYSPQYYFIANDRGLQQCADHCEMMIDALLRLTVPIVLKLDYA